jgi:predicted TIM-barrel fold metal-dependent hydrolase
VAEFRELPVEPPALEKWLHSNAAGVLGLG